MLLVLRLLLHLLLLQELLLLKLLLSWQEVHTAQAKNLISRDLECEFVSCSSVISYRRVCADTSFHGSSKHKIPCTINAKENIGKRLWQKEHATGEHFTVKFAA
eukprot:TRINITY_DN98386_c0_g1_i1.p1 TRINITY_DN98386_c0_g1~~TRINITY_DN98386_c0_g1_i1.p1  ORF type:complete len:104 (+),score=24.71 TRINITY_DN98386_c0_g1_i1:1-312(+)